MPFSALCRADKFWTVIASIFYLHQRFPRPAEFWSDRWIKEPMLQVSTLKAMFWKRQRWSQMVVEQPYWFVGLLFFVGLVLKISSEDYYFVCLFICTASVHTARTSFRLYQKPKYKQSGLKTLSPASVISLFFVGWFQLRLPYDHNYARRVM